ncbi:MAG: J domain-containing protein [Myxococcales bacterium]|nr:MAG: J domain-containing protein [Myxococcales bacterium]
MRALPSATVLCRVLLGLDRARATGTLHLRGEGGTAMLSLEESQVVGGNIDRRVASSHRQLLQSLMQVLQWEGLVLRLGEAHGAEWWRLRDPLAARTLALQVMRAAVADVDVGAVRSDLGGGTYHLTEAGEALVLGAELRPEETAAVFWLRRGVLAEDIPTLPGCGLRGYRFAWMLKLLRGAAPKTGGSYPLLLRKRREVRRQASARVLLDLPEGAGGRDARQALRKLVRDLHPDRFGDSVPPALRRASGEIVTALVNAEATIASE